MPATFPNAVRVYTTKTDLVDTVLAEHVNLLQDEVTAVQSTLGTGLLASTWAGTYTNPSTHLTVAARLINIEAGLTSLDTLKAPKASPALTGTPTAPTAAADTNTTQVATTAFVLGQASSTTPTMAGTAAAGTSTRYARADHVHGTDTTRAPLASPALTGTPTAPTAATSTNSTQVATTAYVVNRIAEDAPTKIGTGATGNWGINITGSAAKLTTARTITLSGDITGSTSFDGSANVTINTVQDSQPFISSFMMAGL